MPTLYMRYLIDFKTRKIIAVARSKGKGLRPLLDLPVICPKHQIKEVKGKKVLRPSGALEDVLRGQTPPPTPVRNCTQFSNPLPLLLRTS